MCVQLEEHTTDNGSSVFNHISDCANYQYAKNLYCIGSKYDINSIQEKPNIIGSAKNWNTLLIILNSGLKAAKQLQLFN